MSRKLYKLLALSLIVINYVIVGYGQSLQTDTITLTSPSPKGVDNFGGNIVGAKGNSNYYYWVITKYPIGNSSPFGPIHVVGASDSLSASNYISLSWGQVVNAIGYDIIRTTSPQLPSSCSCAVVIGTTTNSVNDIGGVLSSYTITSVGGAIRTIKLDNQSYSLPRVNIDSDINIQGQIYQNGGLMNQNTPIKITASSINASLSARYLCDRAGCTFILPVVNSANAGGTVCAINWTGRSGAIVWMLPATTTATMDGIAYGLSITGSTDLGASSCMQAVGVGEYLFISGKGTWTGSN